MINKQLAKKLDSCKTFKDLKKVLVELINNPEEDETVKDWFEKTQEELNIPKEVIKKATSLTPEEEKILPMESLKEVAKDMKYWCDEDANTPVLVLLKIAEKTLKDFRRDREPILLSIATFKLLLAIKQINDEIIL